MKLPRTIAVLAAVSLAAGTIAGCGSSASDDAAAESSSAESSGADSETSKSEDDSKSESEGPRTDKVGVELDRLVDDGALVGAEVTLLNDGSSAQVTAGVGNQETGSEYPRDAHVRVASVTKGFTSAILLQLVAEGKVELDAPIEEYLPGLLRGKGIDAGEITIRHLLRHQSGLPEVGDAGKPRDPSVTYTPRELIDLALERPARFEPGTEMRYTNTNYIVVGMLIESVTDESYADQLKTRITEPLGLDDTYLPEPGDTSLPEPHPHGYHSRDGKTRDVTEQDASGPWTSGGMVSTGADLNRFFTALAKGEVVETEQLKEMRDTVGMTGVPGVDYGLGLMRFPVSCDVTVWGQAGDVPGFQTMVASTADGTRAVSIATNTSPDENVGPQQLLELLDVAVCEASPTS